MVKIEWIEIEFKGPFCGLATLEGEKVWFRRMDTFSSHYGLYRIPEENLPLIEEDHQDVCRLTGRPLKHGDPRIIKPLTLITNKSDEKAEELELGAPTALANTTSHIYRFNTTLLTDLIKEIEEKDFSNFWVKQTAIYQSPE